MGLVSKTDEIDEPNEVEEAQSVEEAAEVTLVAMNAVAMKLAERLKEKE